MKYILYNGEVNLDFNENTHIYSISGKAISGVTGVLGIIAKPGLLYWAVGEAIAYLQRNILPGCSLDEIQLNGFFSDAKIAHRRTSEDAALMGTLAHQWAEDWIAGRDPLMPVNRQVRSSVEQFLKWVERDQVEFLHSEKLVYSKKRNYAGTFDFICKIDGKTYIGDLKTSSAVYDEYFLQVAAYQQAYLEEFPKDQIDGAIIVRIGKKDDLQVKFSDEYGKNVAAFNAAIILHRRMQELKNESKHSSQQKGKGD